MSLENLIGISFETVEPDRETIARLVAAAKRNISDSHSETVSDETRFDAAYKAIMQLANAALQANGYRTLTSKPGHHQTLVQVLGQTAGVDKQTIIVLDALRKQRNATDYTGDLVPPTAVKECIRCAEQLNETVTTWLKKHKPELVD